MVILIWHLRVVKWYALFLGTFDTIENAFISLQTTQNICLGKSNNFARLYDGYDQECCFQGIE